MNREATSLRRIAVGDSVAKTGFITVVGISAGGVDELGTQAREALYQADIIIGSWRQLGLVPEDVSAERRPWPSPMLPKIPEIFAELTDLNVVVLGSGDPMFHGIGSTLIRLLPQHSVTVIPHSSSASLACARLGWPLDKTPVYSLVTNAVDHLVLPIQRGGNFLVLGQDEKTPASICDLLVELNQSDAKIIILSDLGSSDEVVVSGTAEQPPTATSSLNVIAVSLQRKGESMLPGLADAHYISDGQLTKRHIRALTLSTLAPRQGETLWDIGGGSGSIAIEWLRSTPGTTAVCFEVVEERRNRIAKNARSLGVIDRLTILHGAPDSFDEVPTPPDAMFIGGGLTAPGVFDAAWSRLPMGGRLVANAVTIESESVLWELRKTLGGSMARFDISQEHNVGSFTTMKPALPVLQWSVTKSNTPKL
ncbi:precorrin-6Y methyltransferase [Corynebacterium pseudotuberculosis]|uniref:bifunctional cobalt-precorrin-7 (C(5))-methyltransferase/cobalt-precorrin-6B (C(15))-methyltransferase n=1 Tax=Corynebacterium pseudotuberculosis TaxID=1719 RepID=UPI000737C1F0|nr:bifunctional cobalt-precorrin-7 (C(5))-methyltransferase/cobalt-precorrin-6B (C(15))-methyltransferase [Corynebacterium pseudotuberculosis]ALU21479.1 precorrin-6Y methyltransferase [Corynebacterium pseudotuberculosis]ANH23736.1 Precorrin-6Y C5,15-methyltransferase [Corynebacterium pseudotuberculosis]